jgi:hypothetical protein
MLDELSRRLPKSHVVAGSRWAAWSNHVAERYASSVGLINGLERVLLRALRPARTLRDRWLMKTERFFPSITLSVYAVLRALSPMGIGDRLSRDLALLDRWHSMRDQLVQLESDRLNDSTTPAIKRLYTTSRTEFESSLRAVSPIEQIVRRDLVAELLVSKRSAVLAGLNEELRQRLVTQSLRLESSLARPGTATHRPIDAPSLVVARQVSASSDRISQASAQALEGTLPGFGFEGPMEQRAWSQAERSPVAASIDQIADQVIRQIDRKVVAARERMGRTF